jgi:hypothetical protein
MSEVWRPVLGYPGIEASSLGRVRSVTRAIPVAASGYRPAYIKTVRGRVLAQWASKGRCSVSTPEHRCVNVGRLVCLAFHGEPPIGKPNALHRDGNSWNNIPSNLYWGDQIENSADADLASRFRGERNRGAKISDANAIEVRRRRVAGETGRDLAEEFGISQQRVCDIYKGRSAVTGEAP